MYFTRIIYSSFRVIGCNGLYKWLRTSEKYSKAEAESKEKHGVWDPMPELTI